MIQSPEISSPPRNERFFRRIDWSAFWTATLVSLFVYGITLAPTVTLEDSGELAVGGDHLGVPHPPGYPIWTLLAWLFTKLFFFVQFRGQPNPAWSIGFASAVFGALASGTTALLLCRSGRDILRSLTRTTRVIGERTEGWICWASGIAASLAFAFSPANWSQSVIVEVYSLNAFFLIAVLFLAYVWARRPDEPLSGFTGLILGMAFLCLVVIGSRLVLHLRKFDDFMEVGVYYLAGYLLILLLTGLMAAIWRRQPGDRLLFLMSLTFGLGLTNHQTLLMLIPTLALLVLVKDIRLFRDFLIAAIPFALYYLLAERGIIQALLGPSAQVTYMGLVHPTHPTTFLYIALNFGALGAAFFLLPNGRRVAPAILCLELGLLVYLFMPLASEQNPPINWGFPRTWEGFIHAFTRGQYERIVPSNVFSPAFLLQVTDYLEDLRGKFTLPIALLGLLPFAAWNLRWGRRRFRAMHAALAMAAFAVGLVALEEILAPTGAEILVISRAYRLCITGMAILPAVGGLALVIGEVEELFLRLTGRLPGHPSERAVAGLVLLGGMAAIGGIAFLGFTRLAGAAPALTPNEKLGLLLALATPVLVAILVYRLMRGPRELRIDFDRADQKWILATLSGFVMMSVVMVILASPKGDIQDAFVQRVKFISSHELFALWIGYGLLLGLAATLTLFRGRRLVTWAAILCTVILIPAIPLLMNAYNAELIRKEGGAEQNRHDFGWQFGNYPLRGAEAILEELDGDEEPLPNPTFPPAMGPGAVFFGGTDPGRFVPTYMIYSADVRPDVFLITQNALADNTYMSVMRDLMGDAIWIPSAADGTSAFQRYVADVQAGRTPPSADIKIEGGRVSVQGVGGVMLINGILARMIFDRNKARRDFYVEESYVIQWMYPYLSPHGLIMKINKDVLPGPRLSEELTHDDLDFWDWYTRRLTGQRTFLRDVCARKSFSKLRSAIAGIYVVRGMFPEAERAFLEAITLYPLSPEATFRLADLYLRWSRPGDAVTLLETYCRQDPGNLRAADFVGDIKRRAALNDRRQALEPRVAGGKGTLGEALELADIHAKLGLADPFRILLENLLKQQGLPPQSYLRMAQLAAEQRRPELMEKALANYTAAMPADMRGWIDLGALRLMQGKAEPGLQALNTAVRVGKEAAIAILKEDPRFAPLRALPAFQQLLKSAP
jgi:tetratricopeptide (TPR) repeat protein